MGSLRNNFYSFCQYNRLLPCMRQDFDTDNAVSIQQVSLLVSCTCEGINIDNLSKA